MLVLPHRTARWWCGAWTDGRPPGRGLASWGYLRDPTWNLTLRTLRPAWTTTLWSVTSHRYATLSCYRYSWWYCYCWRYLLLLFVVIVILDSACNLNPLAWVLLVMLLGRLLWLSWYAIFTVIVKVKCRLSEFSCFDSYIVIVLVNILKA